MTGLGFEKAEGRQESDEPVFHGLDRLVIERASKNIPYDIQLGGSKTEPVLVLDRKEYDCTLTRQGIYRCIGVSGKANAELIDGMELMLLDVHATETRQFKINRNFWQFNLDGKPYAIRELDWKVQELTRWQTSAQSSEGNWMRYEQAPNRHTHIQNILRNLEGRE